MNMIFAIATGGALGAVLRHGVNVGLARLLGVGFPWGTLTVNIAGSFIMGLLIAVFAHLWSAPHEIKAFLTVGFLGGLTTFSAFSLDAVTLWERGEGLTAGLYVAGSVIFSLAALFAGLFIVRTFSA